MPILQRNNLYRLLMASSLILLALFQGYWLRKVYQEQKEILQNETDNIFVQIVRDMQDSIFRKNWVVLRDSLEKKNTVITIQRDTTIQSGGHSSEGATTAMFFRFDTTMTMRDRDTARNRDWHTHTLENRFERRERMFRSTITAYRSNAPGWGPYFFGSHQDTLNMGEIRETYRKDLDQAGIDIDFDLSRSDSLPALQSISSVATFYPGGSPPIHIYLAQFPVYQPYLLRRMIPNFLFSLFLLAITAMSFLLIYRSLRQQQKLAKLKNDFISNITHELKTPIATVSVALEALNSFQGLQDPARTKEYLDISQHELQRLSILVDRVLKMSMFENKALQLHPERFDLRAYVEKVLQSMGLQFEKAHAKVNLHTEGENFQLEGDAVHLTNVVYNLLDNALKYSKKDPKIDITLKEQNGDITLSVQDNGIGIAHEYQKKVFEQFFRVPQNGSQHNTKGHGLGLSYVSGVVKRHGGHINLESDIGSGSRFTITIPKHHQLDNN